jgi:hypothetical protein
MRVRMRFGDVFVLLLSLAAAGALAQAPAEAARIHIVYMGGNDCPPCIAWRTAELPKLEKSDVFKSVKFSYVSKMIRSPVPPALFLPSEVEPYKEKLDFASSGVNGSPQTAIIVNDEVFDYYFGTRAAEDMVKMLEAIRTGSKYPYERCVKLTKTRSCEVKG